MKLNSSYRELGGKVLKQYPNLNEDRLAAELRRMQAIISNARELVDKRIMDLGCGSEKNTDRVRNPIRRIKNHFQDPYANMRYHPWYCRILKIAGADPVGIDIASNAKEPFESHEIDLTQRDVLNQFPKESIDFANNYFLSVPRESASAQTGTSPGIYLSLALQNRKNDMQAAQDAQLPFAEWREFFRERNMKRMQEINEQIFRQIEELLQEGGAYTLAEFVYRKHNGELRKEKRKIV